MSPMKELAIQSYRTFMREFPDRAYITSVSHSSIMQAMAALFFAGFLSTLPQPAGDMTHSVLYEAVAFVVGWFVVMWLSLLLINRYAPEKFELREMFALSLVFGFVSNIVASVISFAAALLGEPGMFAGGVMSVALGIYMLFVWKDGVSRIAQITPAQAIMVMLVPALIVISVVFTAGFLFFGGVLPR